jgi:tRNA(Arg) A34 adenosine deaminase TadA
LKWSDLLPAWQACLEEAWQAYCLGNVPIGAAVVDAAGNVVSRGRNRISDLTAPDHQTYGSQLAHAELNALLSLGLPETNFYEYALYTTVEPCPLCMGAVYMSGVRQLYFASEDPYGGATDLLGTTPYMSRKPVKVFGPFRGGLAEFACALHFEYILRKFPISPELAGYALSSPSGHSSSRPTENPVIAAGRAEFPRGVALAEKLFKDEIAQKWAADGLSAGNVFDKFIELI